MRELDPPKNPGSAQPDHLLDELESIKNLLASELRKQPSTDIPLLDDLVVNLPPAPPLLDIDNIFDDATTAPTATIDTIPALQFPKFTLDVAISDDLLPSSPLAAIKAPPATAPIDNSSMRNTRRNYHRELLIQELVDEFIPHIEAALHKRLSQLDNDTLQALKNTE